jgi:hypothetical protein
MEVDVNVLGPGVILMVLRKSNCGLIVQKEHSGTLDRGKDVTQKTV